MGQAGSRGGSDEQARQAKRRQGEVEKFVASLTLEEQLLVRVKAELYGGSWDELVTDLEARLQGRPYVLKLATRIEDDLARVKKLRAFEEEHHVQLEAMGGAGRGPADLG
jgi:hypothetical protein